MNHTQPTKGLSKRYLTVMAASLVCILLGLAVFWLYLDRYEKSLPYHTADRVFAEYFAGPDYAALYAFEKDRLSMFETYDGYSRYVRERAEDRRRSYRSIPSGEANIKKYGVYGDGARFAEFELKKDRAGLWALSNLCATLDRPGATHILVPLGCQAYVNGRSIPQDYLHGSLVPDPLIGPHDVYAMDGVVTSPMVTVRYGDSREWPLVYDRGMDSYRHAMQEISVDILEGSSLYLYGRVVGEAYVVDGRIQTEEADRLGLHYRRYALAECFDPEMLGVTDHMGRIGELLHTESGLYVQTIEYDADLEKTYGALAIDAAKAYAKYMTNDSSLTELRRYFAGGTAIYDFIRHSEVYWYTDHIGYRFENANASLFFPRGEDAFSCRVTLDQYIQQNATKSHFLPLDITLFFTKGSGGYLVTDLISNA